MKDNESIYGSGEDGVVTINKVDEFLEGPTLTFINKPESEKIARERASKLANENWEKHKHLLPILKKEDLKLNHRTDERNVFTFEAWINSEDAKQNKPEHVSDGDYYHISRRAYFADAPKGEELTKAEIDQVLKKILRIFSHELPQGDE